jgi:protein ImuB
MPSASAIRLQIETKLANRVPSALTPAPRILRAVSNVGTLSLEKAAPHTRTVRPALPTNDKQLWIKLLNLDLEVHPPQGPILSLSLPAEPGSKVQLGLFSPQLPGLNFYLLPFKM